MRPSQLPPGRLFIAGMAVTLAGHAAQPLNLPGPVTGVFIPADGSPAYVTADAMPAGASARFIQLP